MGIREKFVGGKRGKGELEKEGVIWLETVERFEGRKKKGKKRLVGYERDQVVAGVSEMRTGVTEIRGYMERSLCLLECVRLDWAGFIGGRNEGEWYEKG